MCRSLVVSLLLSGLLVLPGIPLAAQHTVDGPSAGTTLRIAQVVPERPGAVATRPIFSDSVPEPIPTFAPLLIGRERAQMNCPGRPRRVLVGAALGLLLGGAIGYVHGSAGHPGLPHTGADIPDEWEYTPLFALAGGIVGGIIGARTARCA